MHFIVTFGEIVENWLLLLNDGLNLLQPSSDDFCTFFKIPKVQPHKGLVFLLCLIWVQDLLLDRH